MNELLKPGGLMISVTPCLGNRPILKNVMSILSKTGIVPVVRAFKVDELENEIKNSGFDIVETVNLHKSGKQQLIVSKKINSCKNYGSE